MFKSLKNLFLLCMFFIMLYGCGSFVHIHQGAYIEFNDHMNPQIVAERIDYELSNKNYERLIFYIEDSNSLDLSLEKINQVVNKIRYEKTKLEYHIVVSSLVNQEVLASQNNVSEDKTKKIAKLPNTNKIFVYLK